ncbi:cGMP-dependent protein kinase 2 (cGK 2) (cGK2) (cGMP-dependent protein kinase II) (cGKII) [Durusdinium trenchii]|uniref:cGMP-dependent protein kinase 2 (CGK 2) (CGK2) (cGMP-dependent protein kinase II) (cGKII) n=1 Tax=Durusdinium trenchii TaxID=1381693 RepID=A0ABP0QIL3_9DINO
MLRMPSQVGAWFPEGLMNRGDPEILQEFRAGAFAVPVKTDVEIWCIAAVGCNVCWPVKAAVGGLPARIGLKVFRLTDSSHKLIEDLKDCDERAKALHIAGLAKSAVQEGVNELVAKGFSANPGMDGIQSVASSIVEVHEILEFLQKVQLFKRLPEDDLPSLAPVCEVKEYLPGDVVIEQGDEGHELFVIRKAPLSTIILRRSKFDELGLREKLHFKTRKAIGGGFLETAAAKPPCNKTPAEREVMERALSNNSNLQGLVALDEAAINQLIDCAWQEDAKAGLNVISEGDINASFFYIVKSGKFDVLQTSSETGKEERVGHLKAGNSFGELMPWMTI